MSAPLFLENAASGVILDRAWLPDPQRIHLLGAVIKTGLMEDQAGAIARDKLDEALVLVLMAESDTDTPRGALPTQCPGKLALHLHSLRSWAERVGALTSRSALGIVAAHTHLWVRDCVETLAGVTSTLRRVVDRTQVYSVASKVLCLEVVSAGVAMVDALHAFAQLGPLDARNLCSTARLLLRVVFVAECDRLPSGVRADIMQLAMAAIQQLVSWPTRGSHHGNKLLRGCCALLVRLPPLTIPAASWVHAVRTLLPTCTYTAQSRALRRIAVWQGPAFPCWETLGRALSPGVVWANKKWRLQHVRGGLPAAAVKPGAGNADSCCPPPRHGKRMRVV